MKLKFQQSISGTNFNATRGQVMEIADEAEANRFIAAGIAEEVQETSHAADLKAIRKQLEDLALEVAELRESINAATQADDEDEPAEKPAKPSKKG